MRTPNEVMDPDHRVITRLDCKYKNSFNEKPVIKFSRFTRNIHVKNVDV